MNEVVACTSLHLAVSGRVLLRDASFSLAAATSYALVGPSGSGKTSLLHSLCGLRRPDAGAIQVEGQDLWALSTPDRTRLRLTSIGLILQFPELLSELSVAENVAVPLLLQRAPDALSRARHALEHVGLGGFANKKPGTLSGGEAQRVAIARAIVGAPKLIIADEPTGSVDAATAAQLVDLLLSLVSESGTTLLIATHDAAVAARTITTFRLEDGHLVPETNKVPDA